MRGKHAEQIGNDTTRMLKTAKKYNTTIDALRLTKQLCTQLPAWYHISSNAQIIRSPTAKCLLNNHKMTTVADLIKTSACIRNPNANQNPPHQQITYCYCKDCCDNRTNGCSNPHACAQEAQTRLEQITPKLNPLSPGNEHGNHSLTGRQKRRNEVARVWNDEILFDPYITCKNDLSEAFRIFTAPNQSSDRPAK
jgi:hypothetical protein